MKAPHRSRSEFFLVIIAAAFAFVLPLAFDARVVLAARVQATGLRWVHGAAMTAGQSRLFVVQKRLDVAADRILAAGGGGNASIVVAPQRSELRVYWHGRVPTRIKRYAGELDVRVRFIPAAFTLRDLVAYEQKLITYPGVVQVGPRPDGSGLDVTVSRGDLGRKMAYLRATSRVPLKVTIGTPVQPMSGRQEDTPPFSGGSFYESVIDHVTYGCSNGFAMKTEGLHPPFEISAGHCGNNGDSVFIPGQTTVAGEITGKVKCRDVMLINYGGKPGNERVQGRIYTGGPTSTTSIPVSGASPDFVGDTVYTDGATSGEHDGLVVTEVDKVINVKGVCADVEPAIEAQLPDKCVVAGGDSGGPVYAPIGQKSANARGTIIGGPEKPNVQCDTASGHVMGNDTVYYAPLLRPAGDPQIGTLQYYDGSILTGS